MNVFPKIYQPRAANWDKNTAAELWFIHINCKCRGHRQSSEALRADNPDGGKSADRKYPLKLRKYRGVPVHLFIKAAAHVKRKTRRWNTSRGRERGDFKSRDMVGRWGWRNDLTCRPVEPVMGSLRSPLWPGSLIMTSVWPWFWKHVLAGMPTSVRKVPVIGRRVKNK